MAEMKKTTRRRKEIPAYQFKVTLRDSKPPIWRRFVVPCEYTFQEFAEALMVIMGWTGLHLSSFKMPEGSTIAVNFPMDDGGLIDDFADDIDAAEVELSNYLDVGEKFLFTYDFGDNWEHVILLEKVLEDIEYDFPVVMKFKGNCPPEDCGGLGGYYKLLESNAADEDIKEYNIDEVNESLQKFFGGKYKTIYTREGED